MWKYFASNTMSHINVLREIIEEYDNTYHPSIKCTPTFARKPLSYQTTDYTPKVQSRRSSAYSKEKEDFKNWDLQTYKACYVYHQGYRGCRDPGYILSIRASKNYTSDLSSGKSVEKAYQKQRCQGGYVKWQGYNNDFNSWILLTDLHNNENQRLL